MSEEIQIGEETYISSRRASENTDYSQDYIGQLARSSQINARRIGGLWYISMKSLEIYKNQPGAQKVSIGENTSKQAHQDIQSIVSFDGKDYISANRAAQITGYNQDYIGQLARGGKILSRQIGRRWYIDRDGLIAHKDEKDALLAAVQSQSVGLAEHNKKSEDRQDLDVPSMLYASSNDIESYIPILKKHNTGDNLNDYNTSDSVYTNNIPIRVVAKKYPIHSSNKVLKYSDKGPLVPSRKKAYKNPINISLGLILLIIAGYIGLSSISGRSPYLNVVLHQILSINTAHQYPLIDTLGRLLENVFSSDLVYNRK